jgi:hypothetical protein
MKYVIFNNIGCTDSLIKIFIELHKQTNEIEFSGYICDSSFQKETDRSSFVIIIFLVVSIME